MACILNIVSKGYPKYLSDIKLPYYGGLFSSSFI